MLVFLGDAELLLPCHVRVKGDAELLLPCHVRVKIVFFEPMLENGDDLLSRCACLH